MQDIIGAHENAALQVSGGRDSVACAYLLADAGLLDKVTVYWVNSGNAFPETLAIMAHIRTMAPNFVEIDGNQPGIVEQYGMPTDIMPRSCTPIGLMTGQGNVKMQDSYSCCGRVIMQPMHERMAADKITLIIRGQRAADGHKAPVSSGDWENGIQYLFPIESWSREQVDAFLTEKGAPRNRCYDYMTSTPDCMNCSGWWEDGRSAFLKACYPKTYDRYMNNLDIIRRENDRLIGLFNLEFGDRMATSSLGSMQDQMQQQNEQRERERQEAIQREIEAQRERAEQQRQQQSQGGGMGLDPSAFSSMLGSGSTSSAGSSGLGLSSGAGAGSSAGAGGSAAAGGSAGAAGGSAGAGGGSSLAGAGAAAGPWAALAAVIAINEKSAHNGGYRRNGTDGAKDLIFGKVVEQDANQRWSKYLGGYDRDKTGLLHDAGAGAEFTTFDFKNGMKKLTDGGTPHTIVKGIGKIFK